MAAALFEEGGATASNPLPPPPGLRHGAVRIFKSVMNINGPPPGGAGRGWAASTFPQPCGESLLYTWLLPFSVFSFLRRKSDRIVNTQHEEVKNKCINE